MTVAKSGNFANPQWQSWTPALLGQTDNAVATYATQVGQFILLASGLIFFRFKLVTSGTTTKTTLTDNLQVNLPFTAVTLTGDETIFSAKVENGGSAVTVGMRGSILSNSGVCTFQNYQSTTNNASTMTWATTTPGIGALNTAITVIGSGHYQAA